MLRRIIHWVRREDLLCISHIILHASPSLIRPAACLPPCTRWAWEFHVGSRMQRRVRGPLFSTTLRAARLCGQEESERSSRSRVRTFLVVSEDMVLHSVLIPRRHSQHPVLEGVTHSRSNKSTVCGATEGPQSSVRRVTFTGQASCEGPPIVQK